MARARTGRVKWVAGPIRVRWDRGTRPTQETPASLAKGATLPEPTSWEENPSTNARHFVRVVASASAPLIFLRAFQSMSFSTVSAAGVAGKTAESVRLLQ